MAACAVACLERHMAYCFMLVLLETIAMSFRAPVDFMESFPKGTNLLLYMGAADVAVRLYHMTDRAVHGRRCWEAVTSDLVRVRLEEAEKFLVESLPL